MGTLFEGAKNAVETCMDVKPGENVLIVTDRTQYEVGSALRQAAEKITPRNIKLFVLENYGKRPMITLPKEIEETIPWANVTFWATDNKEGEISIRTVFRKLAVKYARHAHMPGITKNIMENGMCVDYHEISRFSQKIYEIVKDAKTARITCKNGTEIDIQFNPNWKWIASKGIFHERGIWGNLPDGEVFTVPYIVNGNLSCVLLGDYFSEKYGVLDEPINFEIKNSRVNLEKITGSKPALIEELKEYLATDENSNRASEFSFPTNFALIDRPLIGNLLQDEKARFHLAFGDPYGEYTGADWSSKTHVDGLIENFDIRIDDKKIMENGKYII